MELQIGPDVEHFKLLVLILAVISGILLAIVGYFLVQRYQGQKDELTENAKTFKEYFKTFSDAQSEQMDEIKTLVGTVQVTVTNLDKVVEVMRSHLEERDPRTEKRLNEHSTIIKDHEKRLNIIEAEHKIAFCKFTQQDKQQ